MRYYIIAGEASGDLHGSNLMKGLYAEDPSADIRFWGGGLMDSVYKEHQDGIGLVQDYNEGAIIGYSQILAHPGRHLKRLRNCCDDIMAFSPDVVILIDYPGFNFRVARFAHEHGLKVFYYIAPKVWASREGRIKKLRAYVDKLFIVFPFEKKYFEGKGIDYIYRGNPLIDAIDNSPALSQTREDFLAGTGLPDKPMVAILAGSRKGEVSTMMPVCSEFADKMHAMDRYSDWLFVIAGAPSRSIADYEPWLSGREEYLKVVFGNTYGILLNSAAAVVNSGTASLEACLLGTPQLVAYNSSGLNFNIGKQIIRVDYISLGNLIAGRKAFKELLQHYFTADNAVSEIRRLIEDPEYRAAAKASNAEIRSLLGGSGASAEVAKAMITELRK